MIPVLVAAGHRVRRARPRRLRSIRQADRAVRLHLRPPRGVDAASAVRPASTCTTSPSSARTGAGSSACGWSPPSPTASPAWSSATPACPPATRPPERGVPGLAASSRSESPTFPIGGIVNGGCATDLAPEVDRRLRRTVPRRLVQGRRPHLPVARAHRRRRPGPRRPTRRRGRCCRTFDQAVPVRVQRPRPGHRRWATAFLRGCPAPRASRTRTIEGGGHFLQEDKGPELAKVIADFIAAT